jgi:tetratricopeptide (TPR) repeat protein
MIDRRRRGLVPLVMLASLLAEPAGARARPQAIGPGDLVVLASTDDALKIGSRVVATGAIHRVYTVDRVNGPWLFLEAEDVAGWAKADQVIPFDRALARATEAIESGSPTAADYNARGLLWADRGRPDLAEADYAEAIRLDPEWYLPLLNRGNLRLQAARLDEARADLSRAAEFAPLDPLPYFNRGLVLLELGNPSEAYDSFGLALRVDPNHANARFNRAATALALGIDGAAADAEAYLALVGWYESRSPYAAILAALEHRREGRPEQAAGLLDAAAEKRSPEAWPYPILEHLRGDLGLQALLDRAVTPDQQAEARSYAGLSLIASGDTEAALPLLDWVVERAEPSRIPHLLARSALASEAP